MAGIPTARRVSLTPPEASGGATVTYDLRYWSQEDISAMLARVKHWRIPFRWEESTQVVTVPAKYEEAMNKLVLGEGSGGIDPPETHRDAQSASIAEPRFAEPSANESEWL